MNMKQILDWMDEPAFAFFYDDGKTEAKKDNGEVLKLINENKALKKQLMNNRIKSIPADYKLLR